MKNNLNYEFPSKTKNQISRKIKRDKSDKYLEYESFKFNIYVQALGIIYLSIVSHLQWCGWDEKYNSILVEKCK
jgi:hypothetical protein